MPDFEPISSQCHRDFSPSDRVLVSQHCYKGRPPLAAALYKPMDAHRMVKFKMFLKLLYRILKLPAFQNACMLIKTHHSFSVVQMYLSFILYAVARHRVTVAASSELHYLVSAWQMLPCCCGIMTLLRGFLMAEL